MAFSGVTRILVLGGGGVFGSRLARILSADGRFELILAGRSLEKAGAVAANLPKGAAVSCAQIDALHVEAGAIVALQPDLVVHCAGPFQGQNTRVAEAAIKAGVPYADLSDGREFCAGFNRLDAAAKDAGVFALTALSTTTALSTAAAMSLATAFSTVSSVDVGVTPGNRAPRGKAVVEAILSYVGEPIPQVRGGAEVDVWGWGALRRIEIAGLGPRLFSPCDTPDPVAMGQLFPQADRIAFSAGLELSVLHLSLFVLARLRRWRLTPNLAGGVSFFHAVADLFEPFGSDRGAMFVELAGQSHDGAPLRRRWSLVAGGGDGPNIPVLGAAALARKLASGERPAHGARMCIGEITLKDFEQEFAAFDIQTRTETVS